MLIYQIFVSIAMKQTIMTNERIALDTNLYLAKNLIDRYDFQIFDSIIVASALETDCSTLYSEDMHHNMVVHQQLKIINPFISN